MAIIKYADGAPVAILNRNRPVLYTVPATTWEAIISELEDLELAARVREREGEAEIEVDVDKL